MSRLTLILAILLSISLVLIGCRRDAQPDPMPEAEAEPAPEAHAEPEPTVPMCGDWVVIVESPTVSGDLDGNRVLRALLDGLRGGGCEAHTTRPIGMPAGTSVLQLAPRLQPMGAGAANLSVIATDTASGDVHSRYTERIPTGDGTAEARVVGQRIAERLVH